MKHLLFVLSVIFTIGCVHTPDVADAQSRKKTRHIAKKVKTQKKGDKKPATDILIINKWELPSTLLEISALAYTGSNLFGCVEDEDGKIFIYNTAAQKIVQEIPFTGPGDFEGFTFAGNTAYAVRADGMLYEVKQYNSGRPTVQEYKTPLSVSQNIEGLCYDKGYNRLLLSVKDREPGNPNYKGIYAFDLTTKKLAVTPVYKLDLSDELLQNAVHKQKEVMPSAICRHPATGELYIVDGPGARLLIMDKAGNLVRLYNLGKEFAKPEGITFSPEGAIYISNEGKKDPANIIQIQLP